MTIEIRKEGTCEKIFKDDKYDGEVIALDNGTFRWRNLLAPRLDSPFTNGVSRSRRTAFAQLGYLLKDEPKKGKKVGK